MKTWGFRLELEMGNAAFEEPETELMVILHKLSMKMLETPDVLADAEARHPVVDSNGNTVGYWEIVEVEDTEAGWIRSCDECGRITDAGEYPDWINGVCEECDPEILDHPENVERLSSG